MTTAISRSPVEAYESSHQHPANRALHAIGIPVIACGGIAALFGPRVTGISRRTAVASVTAGWILLFVGHAIEGNRPAIFAHRGAALDALRWWGRGALKVCGRAFGLHDRQVGVERRTI